MPTSSACREYCERTIRLYLSLTRCAENTSHRPRRAKNRVNATPRVRARARTRMNSTTRARAKKNQDESNEKAQESKNKTKEVAYESMDGTNDQVHESKSEPVDADQTKNENETGQNMPDLPDVPTTVPGEHDLPDAKKLKTDHQQKD